MPQTVRRAFIASGRVQGVGFRPFVYRLARDSGLTGSVRNTSDGVRMEVQGAVRSVECFARRLQWDLPPLARLTALTEHSLDTVPHESDFVILTSLARAGHTVLVSPDIGLCENCLADVRDPANRRFAYPFTNCTNCGPRFTITRAIPYDRANTTMECFPLCPDCAAEYNNPDDRRFHAQPIACPVCGPRVWFVDTCAKTPLSVEDNQSDALARAATALCSGHILAVRGLGGFQLACDAYDTAAIGRLRQRKDRPHKPLALMTRDVAAARTICTLTPEHEALLQCAEKPIVLCPRLPHEAQAIPREIAPDTGRIGLMLPTTPLHAALFDHLARLTETPPALVMTSANAKGEPLCLSNREALARLENIADGWLLHDRDILARADDSVLAVRPSGAPLFFRRARGYVPRPLPLPHTAPCVFGAGAEFKNTFCLTRGRDAFVSQHIGDMENPATLAWYEQAALHLENLLEVCPQAFVCDAHPNFSAGLYARERAARAGAPVWNLQHHAAHAASVLAENACLMPALALCLDGTGFGLDSTVWGGELLFMDLNAARWHRMGRLAPFALPGGDSAAHEPWRCALALQKRAGAANDGFPPSPDAPSLEAIRIVREMLKKNLHSPQTSSCGRLFDAVSAQLGLCFATTYEGQAAVCLEEAADASVVRHAVVQPVAVAEREGLLELDSADLFAHVLEAQKRGTPPAVTAARFHVNLAHGLAALTAQAASTAGTRLVGLSGGVMHNAVLGALLSKFLTKQGLTPLFHHKLPPGDGGISFGQAVWGGRLLST
ncbi:MAG: [NiFe] hydrogenase maturation protein HypF [Candidatus Desulfovibrio kirbyi]|uniref:Carbamoyltransferase n=1 Tax=Candidatus Desulfovibrio kirbyi TaxID=2696086 RepID=A0A6L2R4J2_9BACT|nr:MAG: [NiFe] hydrogenase maturation protein HypF [Candidatus Desulfovibrio kirbyi]